MSNYEPETLELTEEVRKKHTDGVFLKLPSGVTHCKIEGEGERYVVLVHGYATPLFIYDKIAEGLVQAGYRVVRYDLYGRGLSDRPKVKYTASFLAKQLHETVQAVLPGKKFVLVGTSMGGIVTTTYIAEYDPPVEKLVLLAPAGMPYKVPFIMRLASVKGIGEFLFFAAKRRQERTCAAEMVRSGEEAQKAYREKYAYYAQYKGLRRATLSSLRYTLLDFEKSMRGYNAFKQKGIPLLVIWGTKDNTMPYFQSATLMETIPDAKLITYQDSGHIFLYDEGERTVKDILDFLE